MKLLLECDKVNPDSADTRGRTPLLFAAWAGSEGVVKLLLERHEVNPHLPNRNGRTPLSFATLGQHGGVMKLLLGRGDVDPSSSDSLGQMPLRESVVGLLSEARSSNSESLGTRDPMPTSVTGEISSGQEVKHPLTATDDVTLYTVDHPLLDPLISCSVTSGPPQEQPLPFKLYPLDQLRSLVATSAPTPAPSSLTKSPLLLLTLVLLIFQFFLFLQYYGFGDSRELFHAIHSA